MDVERTISPPASETEKGGRLAVILADMLRSALAWEQEHGRPEYPTTERSGGTELPMIVGGAEDHDRDD